MNDDSSGGIPRRRGTFKPGQPRPPRSGRQKGQPNKSTVKLRAIQAKLVVDGKTPLEYLVNLMMNSKAAPDRRDRAAIAVMPFMHAKVAPRPPTDARAPGEVAAEIRQALALMHGATTGALPDEDSSSPSPDSSSNPSTTSH